MLQKMLLMMTSSESQVQFAVGLQHADCSCAESETSSYCTVAVMLSIRTLNSPLNAMETPGPMPECTYGPTGFIVVSFWRCGAGR